MFGQFFKLNRLLWVLNSQKSFHVSFQCILDTYGKHTEYIILIWIINEKKIRVIPNSHVLINETE